MNKRILDIGCGNNKIKGAIGLDIDKNTRADIIWDLNKYPRDYERFWAYLFPAENIKILLKK